MHRLTFSLTIAVIAFSIFSAKGSEPSTGTVIGTVTYKADAKRPWRHSRFYLKSTNTLAETVVALHGTELKKHIPTRKPAVVEVDQRDFMFKPETSAIQVGDTVRFLNNDGPTHNVRSTHDSAMFNENMPAGGEYLHTFKKATGINFPVTLGCIYHGNMRAWIYVFDNPWFHVTDETGSFRFENVPRGELRLDIMHPAGQLKSTQAINVKANETTRVSVVLTPDDVVK